MLIKGSASRFYRRIREDLPAETGWPCLSGAVSRKVPPAENAPLRASVRRAFLRCVARTLSALRMLFPQQKDAPRPPDQPCCRKFRRTSPIRLKERRAASKLKGSAWTARVRHQIDVEPSCSPCRSDARPLIRNPPAPKTTRTMPGFLHAGVCRLCRQQNHRAAKRAARATRLTHAQKMHKKRAANLGLQLSLS